MSSYQIVSGYLTDDGTWVSPYLGGVPNGIDFDNVNFDPASPDINLDCFDSANHQTELDMGNFDPDLHGDNADVGDIIDLG